MQKVTINGIAYIGVLKKKDGNFTLKDAMAGGVLDRNTIMGYLKARNTGTLQDIKFGGQGTNYAIAELTALEKMDLAICKLGMEQAKSTAVQGLENDTFDGIMGKQ